MKSLTIPRRILTAALGAILLSSSIPAVVASPGAPSSVKALLTFGDPSHIEHAGDLLSGRQGGSIVQGDSLSADQLAQYTRATAGAVAVVAARDIAVLGDSRATLMKLFHAGVPVFVCADDGHRADVARLFGVAPERGDAMFVRNDRGEVAILGDVQGERHWVPRWSESMAESLTDFRENDAPGLLSRGAAPGEETDTAGAPVYTFHEGLVETGTDEITGRAIIQVVRSVSRSGDDKEISVRAWSTITPKDAGIVKSNFAVLPLLGHRRLPLTVAATLPWTYRTSHKVLADRIKPQLVHSLPTSNGSTKIDYEKIEKRGYTIGGGVGATVSASGKPNAALAAKLRFDLSFSYTNEKTETIRYTFQDYSMFARPVDSGTRMLWEAPIAPHLKDALIKDKKKQTFTDGKDMTPMMFSGSLDTWSVWKVPGEYEGSVTVEVEAGYDRNERLRSSVKPRVGYFAETKPVTASRRYVLDLSHPFLTREITVLIRSAAGDGGCLAEKGGNVSLSACDPSNRSQMWGLDSESRYVNRATKHCLTADSVDVRLKMSPCTLANSQRWEWQADRLHSGYDDGHHRLYVERGEVRFHVPPGRFAEVPANPHNAVLPPWSGYPRAPYAGELIPAPHGVATGSITAAQASALAGVGPEQRWDIVVLRAGLAPGL